MFFTRSLHIFLIQDLHFGAVIMVKFKKNILGFGRDTLLTIIFLHSISIIQRRLHRTLKASATAYFVDFSQAFDSVPRDKLLNKLLTSGITAKMYGILKSIKETIRACILYFGFFLIAPLG